MSGTNRVQTSLLSSLIWHNRKVALVNMARYILVSISFAQRSEQGLVRMQGLRQAQGAKNFRKHPLSGSWKRRATRESERLREREGPADGALRQQACRIKRSPTIQRWARPLRNVLPAPN